MTDQTELSNTTVPVYVSRRIGAPRNDYLAVLKALADSVEAAVYSPSRGGNYSPSPENTATPAEIAAKSDVAEVYVRQALMPEFIKSGLVYYDGESYVIIQRRKESYDGVISHYSDRLFTVWDRVAHRIRTYLFLKRTG